MKRRTLMNATLAVAAAHAAPRMAFAQAPTKPVRIGWLSAQTAASLAPYIEVMRGALAERGYVEGRNLTIDFRYGNDAIERVPELAAELERMPVDVLLAQGSAVSVIQKLGLKVPVVYVFSGDPVSAGFAQSLARPEGNMTGLTFMAAELNVKRLEMLREIMPKVRDVVIVANPEHPGSKIERDYCEDAARKLGMSLRYFWTRTRGELDAAFSSMSSAPPQALSVFADGFAVANRQAIIDFAASHHAPVISGWPVFASSGAICTYGPRLTDSYKRLAYYVDRVLNGVKPADIPIERPTTFQLVVNLKAAKTLDLTMPQALMVRADDVIQ
jgi:putative ABC transport system substrate-binding protein